jgi:hypothetical protein
MDQETSPGAAAMPQTLEQRKEAWKRKYGEILEARLGKTEWVGRPADLDEWERLQDKLAEDRHPAAYLRELTLNVTLYPEREQMEVILQRYHAFPDAVCSKLREHGGGKIEILVKKG